MILSDCIFGLFIYLSTISRQKHCCNFLYHEYFNIILILGFDIYRNRLKTFSIFDVNCCKYCTVNSRYNDKRCDFVTLGLRDLLEKDFSLM